MRRLKRRHPYTLITSLQQKLDMLVSAQTLGLEDAFTEKAISQSASLRERLVQKTEATRKR